MPDMLPFTVEPQITETIYDGKNHAPENVVVKNGETVLDENSYKLTYSHNGKEMGNFSHDSEFKDAGVYIIYAHSNSDMISGSAIGWYGTAVVTIKTVDLTLKDNNGKSMYTVEPEQKSYVYDGTDKEPGVVIKDINNSTVNLIRDIDYELSYLNNTNAGTATAVVNGKGNYAGTTNGKFIIEPMNLMVKPSEGQKKIYGDTDPELTYIIVPDSTGVEIKGKLSRNKGENAGVYGYDIGELFFTGTKSGNYRLMLDDNAPKFTIEPKDISPIVLMIQPQSVVYTGTEQNPTITVKDKNSRTLDTNEYALYVVDANGEEKEFKNNKPRDIGTYSVKAKVNSVNYKEAVSESTFIVSPANNNSGGSGGGSSSNSNSNSGTKSNGVTLYTVSINNAVGGKVTANQQSASSGTKITLTVISNSDYELDSINVKNTDGSDLIVNKNTDSSYTFVMPANNVTVTPVFKKLKSTVEVTPEQSVPSVEKNTEDSFPLKQFKDIDHSAWYHDGINFCLEKNLMKGVSESEFTPEVDTNRSMIVTILWRLNGSPEIQDSSFSDVESGKWYSNAISWAAKNSIVKGYDDGKFGINDNITREQFATVMYRYSVFKNYNVEKISDLNQYTDKDKIHDWAFNAMGWANAEGLITGRTESTLEPNDNITRAEIATVLMRFYKNFVK